VTSWSDGASIDVIDFEGLQHMGLELLPTVDEFPKGPYVYSAVLLVAAVGFVLIELRR